MDEKQKEKHVSADSDLESESLDVTSVTQGTMLRLQTSHDDLQEAIVKYENIVENLEHLWETKVSIFNTLSTLDKHFLRDAITFVVNSATCTLKFDSLVSSLET